MKLNITVLGSGSQGNAFLIHHNNEALLVDAGFSRKELLKRIKDVGLEPEIVKAMLITHEHGDHVKGVRVFGNTYQIPTYASIETAKYMKAHNKINEQFVVFDAGTAFQVGAFVVQPFSVPHDAVEPVGFIVSHGDCRVGVATDLGHVTRLVAQRLKGCDALIFESNHDIGMLRNSSRPYNLIRRIMGRHGHLNNQDALDALEEIVTDNTKALILSHLSGECNCHSLVGKIAQQKLAEMKRADILLSVAEQQQPLKTLAIE